MYYTVYTYYIYYFSGKCSPRDTGIARFSQTPGSFCTVSLFGAWSYQIQWCTTGLLQSISGKNISWQSLFGHCQIRPPGVDNGAFVVTPETVWYARVLLLFSASAATDTGSKSFECTLMSTLETYDDPENGNYMDYITYICYVYYTY